MAWGPAWSISRQCHAPEHSPVSSGSLSLNFSRGLLPLQHSSEVTLQRTLSHRSAVANRFCKSTPCHLRMFAYETDVAGEVGSGDAVSPRQHTGAPMSGNVTE